MDVTEQVIDVRSQSTTTRDGVSVAVGVSIAYRISDPLKAIYAVQDVDVSLSNEALRIVQHFVSAHTFDECNHSDEMADEILRGVREAATARWGVKVFRVGVTDFSRHKAIRLMNVTEGGDD